jgi:energy-coupling factor transporter ATP-binding protein EcfA2
MKTEPVRITRIIIDDVLGISHAELRPGALTLIQGVNGSGKSSHLAAVRGAVQKGHHPELIRIGATEARLQLDLSDGMIVRRRITADKTDTTLEHPTYGPIKRPQQYLDSISDAVGLNVVGLITADAASVLKLLLEAMPLRVTAQQIADATGKPELARSLVNVENDHAFTVLARLEKVYYDDRTGANSVAKEKRATVAQLTKTLPPAAADSGASWANRLTEIEGEIEECAARDAAQMAELARVRDAAEAKATAAQSAKTAEINAELQRRIAALEAAARQEIEAVDSLTHRTIDAARQAYTDAAMELNDDIEPAALRRQEQLAEAKLRVEEQARADGVRDTIAQQQAGAEASEAAAAALTQAIDGLRRLRAEQAATLPIHGVEIVDGDVRIDGTPWSTTNTSRRIRLAVELAKLRAGALRAIVVDDLEHLDPAAFAEFCAEAAAADVQIFGARVTAGPLSVEAA